MPTGIEWTDETWNPVTGCTKVSPGCDHCYAERITDRFKRHPFTEVTRHVDRLYQPCKWKDSRRIFVCSMGDLFHRDVGWGFTIQIFAVMRDAPQHTFQVLTKRPGLMAHFANFIWPDHMGKSPEAAWPSNVWAGTSVESPKYAARLDVLARVPAKVRFVSYEPALGPVDVRRYYGYNPSHGEVEELRRYCLQCGYQWRTDDRPARVYLEGVHEGGRQMERHYNASSSDPEAGRASPTIGIPSDTLDDQLSENERSGPPFGVPSFLRSDTNAVNGEPQEWDQGRQSAREPGVGDTFRAADTFDLRPRQRPGAASERPEQSHGEVDRCPSCGDTCPTWRRGTAYLDSFGFWHRFPNRLQDSQGTAPLIHWTIGGGESGPGARPAHPDWFRSARDQCQAAGVPFFFKQWGQWRPAIIDEDFDYSRSEYGRALRPILEIDGVPRPYETSSGTGYITERLAMARVGKKAAGALLDGREWREMPNG